MDNTNEVLKIYKKGIKSIGLLIPILFMGFLIFVVLFSAEGDIALKLYITLFFLIFEIVLVPKFYNANKSNQNALFIKQNGIAYRGKVLHVKVDHHRTSKGKSKTIRHLLISFNNRYQNKLIVSGNFPYYIDTNSPDLVDMMTNKFNIEEYKHSYEENILNHLQFFGKGYITFEENGEKQYAYYYNESANKNFDGEIICNVYEYDGKYVVDDFEGIDIKKIRRDNLFAAIFIILFLGLGFFILKISDV